MMAPEPLAFSTLTHSPPWFSSFAVEPLLGATVWLTPYWLTALGFALGLVLILLLLAKIALLSKIPFLNSVSRDPGLRFGLSAIVAAFWVLMYLWFYSSSISETGAYFDEHSRLGLCLVVPVALFVAWGFWGLIDKDRVSDSFRLCQEGFLSWMNVVVVKMTVVALLGLLLSMNLGLGNFRLVEEPFEMMQSIARLPFAVDIERDFTVSPSAANHTGDEFPIEFNGEEVRFVEIQTDQKIELASQPITSQIGSQQRYSVDPSHKSSAFLRRPDGNGRIPNEEISRLYINNLGGTDAHVKLKLNIEPIYREVWLVPCTAVCVLGVYLLYLAFMAALPKTGAIALSTFKTEVSQPVYIFVMSVGIVFLGFSIWIPYNTFGEDIKMYKDSGLTLIRVLAIFVAIWAAGKSVSEEIEGRTALTVLSKPVGRRQFIFGKYAGICLAIAAMFVILGLWFELWTAYKPVYDARESSKGDVAWEECFLEATRMTPALVLTFLEVTIFVAIAIAISTRFGILVNFLLCFSIYVLGHLTPLIVNSADAVNAFEPVVLFGQVIAVIFPVLDHFDVQAAINTNNDVPLTYLGWSLIYTVIYGAMAMLLALVFFEDRDLA